MTIFDVRPEAALQRAPEGEGWVASSHRAVQTVLRDPGWSSDHRKASGFAGYQADRGIPDVASELLSKVLLFMDPPDHTRLRRLISKAFTPRSVERLRPASDISRRNCSRRYETRAGSTSSTTSPSRSR